MRSPRTVRASNEPVSTYLIMLSESRASINRIPKKFLRFFIAASMKGHIPPSLFILRAQSRVSDVVRNGLPNAALSRSPLVRLAASVAWSERALRREWVGCHATLTGLPGESSVCFSQGRAVGEWELVDGVKFRLIRLPRKEIMVA